MKVLIVNKFLYPNGGSETYIFKIGQQLQKMGHEVQYFGMEHAGRIVGNRVQSYTSDMDFHGSKLRKILYPFKIIYSIEARKQIRKVLDDFQPDAVHLNNINFQITPSVIDEIVAYRRKSGRTVQIIYTAHDYQWICPNHMLMIPSNGKLCTACIDGQYENCEKNRCIHNSRLRSMLGTWEARYYQKHETYQQVDRIICPSDFMQRMLAHNSQLEGKLITIHNFMDCPENTGKLENIPENAEKESNRAARRYVLYFGRYDTQKGIHTLLQVCRELPDISFVFAGKGELEEEINEVGNIHNVGFLNGQKLQEMITNAEFTVFPSEWYENCPFSVMESQMYGTPVIASDLGGTPELIRVGRTGELFRGGDAEELKERISGLWEDTLRLQQYRQNCLTLSCGENNQFDTLASYCSKLVKYYSGTEK